MTSSDAQRLASEDADVSQTDPVTTTHEGEFHGVNVTYAATAGRVPLKGPDGSVDAQIFYASYLSCKHSPRERPLIFFTNGGPGAATAWLHLGGLGPQRIVMHSDGSTPPPPARLEDNADCPLNSADLVFIDAPGTGYSRVASEEAKQRIFDRDGDLGAYASFIQQFLRQNGRWASPLYLFGESYGAMRMAGLADLLVRQGVPVKGVILMSSALDFHLLSSGLTNPLPHVLNLPTFATVAAFHGRLGAQMSRDGDALRREVEQWSETVYLPALIKGQRLSGSERTEVIGGLMRYTGLPEPVIVVENLRIEVPVFMKYLLGDRGLVTGRSDGRVTGPAPFDRVEEPYYDPSMGAMTPAFSSAAQQLFGDALGFSMDLPYRMYSRDVATRFALGPPRKYGNDGYPQSLTSLQSAAVKNPDFRILSIQGLYDLAAPYRTTEHALDQMPVAPSMRKNITQLRLAGGHMIYTDAAARGQIGRAITEFVTAA